MGLSSCLKDEGNRLFSDGKYQEAMEKYSEALKDMTRDDLEIESLLYNNRAACNLKLHRYHAVLADCEKVLSFNSYDLKALHRKAQALRELKQVDKALECSHLMLKIQPDNKSFQRIASDLSQLFTKSASLSGQYDRLMEEYERFAESGELPFGKNFEKLHSLLLQDGFKNYIYDSPFIDRLKIDISLEKTRNLCVKIVRILCQAANIFEYLRKLFSCVGSMFCEQKCLEDSILVDLIHISKCLIEHYVRHVAQNLGIERSKHMKYHERQECKSIYIQSLQNMPEVYSMTTWILNCFTGINKSFLILPNLADAFISLVLVNDFMPEYYMAYSCPKTICDTTGNLLKHTPDIDEHDLNLPSLLKIIGKFSSCLGLFMECCATSNDISKNFNQMILSSLKHFLSIECFISALAVVYVVTEASHATAEHIFCETDSQPFLETVRGTSRYIKEKEISLVPYWKLKFTAQSLISVCSSKKLLLLLASNESDSVSLFLEYLYTSQDIVIRSFGVIGLTKFLNSNKCTQRNDELFDASIDLVQANVPDEVKIKLLEALAVLTLDPELKEKLVICDLLLEELRLICKKYIIASKKIIDFREGFCDFSISPNDEIFDDKSLDKHLNYSLEVFCIVTVLSNVTNSTGNYKKICCRDENSDDLQKLAEYAGQPVEKEHKLDGDEFVEKRTKIICSNPIFSIPSRLLRLVFLEDSEKIKYNSAMSYQIAEFYFHAFQYHKHRVDAVRLEVLPDLLRLSAILIIDKHPTVPLINDSNMASVIAAHAVARALISINPEIALPNGKYNEAIVPLLCLIDFRREPLCRFEALLALTNIFSSSEANFSKIVKSAPSFHILQTALFDDNERISLAAVQCVTNLVQSEDVITTYFVPNIRPSDSLNSSDSETNQAVNLLKLMLSYAGDFENLDLCSASSATLAILSNSQVVCEWLITFKNWLDNIVSLLTIENWGIVLRALVIVANICAHGSDLAENIVSSQILEILMALDLKLKSIQPDSIDQDASHCINEVSRFFEIAIKFDLIKSSIEP